MRVNSAFVANYAEEKSGVAYVSGGFPEWWTVTDTPMAQTLALVWTCELEANEVGRIFLFDVFLDEPDGTSQKIVHVGVGRRVLTGDIQEAKKRKVVAVNVPVTFRMEGAHVFRIESGDDVRVSVDLYVAVADPRKGVGFSEEDVVNAIQVVLRDQGDASIYAILSVIAGAPWNPPPDALDLPYASAHTVVEKLAREGRIEVAGESPQLRVTAFYR